MSEAELTQAVAARMGIDEELAGEVVHTVLELQAEEAGATASPEEPDLAYESGGYGYGSGTSDTTAQDEVTGGGGGYGYGGSSEPG